MATHRSPLTTHGFFVTGTDTAVGKTLVACTLLHAFAARGRRVSGMKPVAAGGAFVHEDVAALKAASNVKAPDELINQYCFEPPVAPHIAAASAGIAIDLERVTRAYGSLASYVDCVIVEGAGGFCVPLGPRLDTGDLAARLALPVILVVGMRLGCLNHALLTAAAVQARGLRLAGWVANHIDGEMACATENVTALANRLPAPLIARISYGAHTDAASTARLIELEKLYDGPA
jgi:dethiobiotin synthetase